MAIHCVRPDISGEFRNPFDCDELIVKALVTVSAFVALADGQLDAIERDEAVNYIERQQLPRQSRGRVLPNSSMLARETSKTEISRI
jgi:tellurite resistance protein